MPPFSAWFPRATPISFDERARSFAGALISILLTGLICKAAVGEGSALPALIAPMGASAVLMFAVPASPLAQPWSILGGNLIASVIGVSAANVVPNPSLAAAVAVAVSIVLMTICRCIHPPSGAVALTAVLGGPAIRDLGYGFVLWPVGANSLVLLAIALVFNNLVGRSYPHRPLGVIDHGTKDVPPAARIGFTSDDLDAALAEYDQLLDVDRGDLEAILRSAEIRSYRRRAGHTTCDKVMSRDVVVVAPDTPIREALTKLRRHGIRVLPVTDDTNHVRGVVTQSNLLDLLLPSGQGSRASVRQRLGLDFSGTKASGKIKDIMTTKVATATPDMPVADVVRLMERTGLHHLPVVDPDGKLVGLVSQSDLLVALLAAPLPSDPGEGTTAQ